jgi:hypothetical protein
MAATSKSSATVTCGATGFERLVAFASIRPVFVAFVRLMVVVAVMSRVLVAFII